MFVHGMTQARIQIRMGIGMQIKAKVNFGEDLGHNIGTVFEARDSEGQVLFGAGFMGLFNTHFRMDRWTLSSSFVTTTQR